MSEQAQEQNLTVTMQEMMAQMARMQAELDSLKQKAPGILPQPEAQARITSTRRKTLKRMGLALLGGVVAATATNISTTQAKVINDPSQYPQNNKIAAIIIPASAPNPIGTATAAVYATYGVVTSTGSTAFDLSTLPGSSVGVYAYSPDGWGVVGKSATEFGVLGDSQGGTGVTGYSKTGIGTIGSSRDKYGIEGFSNNSSGVHGRTDSTAYYTYGVFGENVNGLAYTAGVYGRGKNIGVFGEGAPGGVGLYGKPGTGQTLGAHIEKNCQVDGSLYAGAKFFKIDHPLDPENKYLHHVSIESPDMKNLYDGVVALDEWGEAVVVMPDWFEALNSDFRYQLTSIGASMPDLFIAEKMADRRFKIAGGKSGQEVSWMITGIRQDTWAKANPIPVEEDKTSEEKGKYLHFEAFGMAEEMSVNTRLRVF